MKKKTTEKELTENYSIEIDVDTLNFEVKTQFSYAEDDFESALTMFDVKIFGNRGECFHLQEKEADKAAVESYLKCGAAEEIADYILIGRAIVYSGLFEEYFVNPQDALDIEESTFEYKELYNDDDEYLCEDAAAYATDEMNRNICIIDRIEILPHFRGQHLGLVSLVALSKKLKFSASLLAIKAYPIQHNTAKSITPSNIYWGEEWANAMNYPKRVSEAQWKKDKKKLATYYEKAGFAPIRKGYFMVAGEASLDENIENEISRKRRNQVEAYRNSLSD